MMKEKSNLYMLSAKGQILLHISWVEISSA